MGPRVGYSMSLNSSSSQRSVTQTRFGSKLNVSHPTVASGLGWVFLKGHRVVAPLPFNTVKLAWTRAGIVHGLVSRRRQPPVSHANDSRRRVSSVWALLQAET